jgi:hypothetical protein
MDIMGNLSAYKEKNKLLRNKMEGETYDSRIQFLLDESGFGN